MKKSLLSIMGVAVTVLAFGQTSEATRSTESITKMGNGVVHTVAPAPITNSNRAAGPGNGTAALGTILFTETFGAGLAGDGTNGPWTTNGTVSGAPNAGAEWEYRGTSTTPDNTVGSRGAYAGPLTSGNEGDPVASVTLANGFFIFDSDFKDNAGIRGNSGNGIAPTPHQGWLVSSTFSTMGSNNLVIDLTTYFRRFAGNGYVLLSNDGGATWGDSVVIFDTQFGVNNASTTNMTIHSEVNYIANTANAKIALYFDGASAEASANGLGYYFVMIDDVVVSEAPDNDLSFDANFYQTTADTGGTNYYTMVPSMLATFDTVQFSGMVTNRGNTDQTNTIISNVITTPAGTSTLSSMGTTVTINATDSLVIPTTSVLDAGVGMYSWVLSTSSDSTDDVAFNNFVDTVFVEVTDSTYARDRNATGTFTYNSGSAYEMGNMFEINDSVKATSISVTVGAGSTHGENISVYLYTYSETTSAIVTNLLSQHEFYTLDSVTIGTSVAYTIPEVVLPPGRYLATYKTYTTDVGFSQSDFTTDPLKSFVDVGSTGSFNWADYTTPVRLNVSADLIACNVTATAVQTSNNTATATGANGTAPYTYVWDNGETAAIATTLTSGSGSGLEHFVTVTDDLGCTASTSAFIVTGIIEAGIEGDVSMYPNPNNGTFQLSLEGVKAGNYLINVTNILGQSIYVNNVDVNGSYNKKMSFSNLESGIYFIEITNSNDEKSVIRFVVE